MQRVETTSGRTGHPIERSAQPSDTSSALAARMTVAQREAATYLDGPLRIVAGAGTGKTTVISARFAHLVDARGVAPERILALTFSRKAAEEMRARIVSELSRGYRRLWVQTFHSFCLRALGEEAARGGAPMPRVLGEIERRALTARLVAADERPRRHYHGERGAQRLVADAMTLISRAKDHLITPGRFAEFAAARDSARLDDLGDVYRRYQEALLGAAAVDFAEIGYRFVLRLREDGSLRARWAGRFDHIIVDEFQDTNEGQYQLLRLLAPPGGTVGLCVVGDPDQSIYAFRGASRGYMDRLGADYLSLRTIPLPENHRSQPRILAAANALIANNPTGSGDGVRVPLRAAGAVDGPPVSVAEFATGEDEARHVASAIARGVREGRFRARDCAILCRSVKASGSALAAALAARGIPYQVGGLTAADYETIEDLLAALHTVAGAPGWPDLRRLLARRADGATLQAFEGWLRAAGATDNAGPADLAALAGEPLDAMVYRALLATGHLTDAPTPAQVELTRGLLAEAAGAGPDIALPGFIAHLAESYGETEDEPPGQGPGVTLLTAHAAKGLEWPVVFVVGLAEGHFPLPMRLDRTFDLDELARWHSEGGDFRPLAEAEREVLYREEERRLAYVALTRARRELHLTWARSYGDESRPAAPFVSEVLSARADGETSIVSGKEAAEPETPGDLARDLYAAMMAALDTPADAPDAAARLGDILSGVWAARRLPGAVPLRRRALPAPNTADTTLTLSFSQLETYAACPRQYLYASVIRLKRDVDAPHATFGSAVHDALLRLNTAWLERGTPPGDGEIAEAVDLAFGDRRVRFAVPGLPEQARARALAQLGRYYAAERLTGRRPVAVEHAFDYRHGAHTIRGVIDCVLLDASGAHELVDYKTGRGDDLDPATSLQLHIYERYWSQLHPGAPVRVAYHLLRHPDDRGRAYAPVWCDKQALRHTHTAATRAALHARFEGLVGGILGNCFDARDGVESGTCERCPYGFICPEGLA